MRIQTMAVMAAVALAACSSTPAVKPEVPVTAAPAQVGTLMQAEAALAPASASIVSGRLVLVSQPGGVRITGTLGGLRPHQQAGFHVHERGDCSAVDGSSAGAHFNPTGSHHGRHGQPPHHLGDIDNLQADAAGRVAVDTYLSGVVLGGGALNDVLGRALIVHSQADDYRSQPAGNAGARVACGVIRQARQS